MKKQTRTWLFAFVLLGLGASLTSLHAQYRLRADPAYADFCSFNETLNCETAYRSRVSTFGGVPVALGAVAWFTLALLLTLAARHDRSAPGATAERYLFV